MPPHYLCHCGNVGLVYPLGTVRDMFSLHSAPICFIRVTMRPKDPDRKNSSPWFVCEFSCLAKKLCISWTDVTLRAYPTSKRYIISISGVSKRYVSKRTLLRGAACIPRAMCLQPLWQGRLQIPRVFLSRSAATKR